MRCPRRSRLWWYRRMRRAYRLHGALPYSRGRTWADAVYARRGTPARQQWQLPPIKGPSAGRVQP